MWLLMTLGAEVSIASPVSLQPKGVSQFDVKVFGTLDDALDADPNVVMTLRVQRERMTSGFFPTESEYATFWGMSAARLSKLSDSSIVMHPGPMNRGLEIASSVADSSQSTVTEQVANGISARMAVLNNIMGGH
jgi:aspartate carbamoyltransferase catalytic subunit